MDTRAERAEEQQFSEIIRSALTKLSESSETGEPVTLNSVEAMVLFKTLCINYKIEN